MDFITPLVSAIAAVVVAVVAVLTFLRLRKRSGDKPSADREAVVVDDGAHDNVVATGSSTAVGHGSNITEASTGDKGIAAGRDVNIYQATPATTPASSLHQLPPPPIDFVGREDELEKLTSEMERGATISGVRGMGGVGKTALALVVAQRLTGRYSDAQIYLNLHGASEQEPLTTAEAMAHVVRSFRPDARLPEAETELAPLYLSTLHGKRVLLLMDNAAGKEQVEPLIPPQGCAMLVTSRQRFTLPGLRGLDLDVMDPQDAENLVLRIAPRVGDRYAELAERCGRLPLVLRLAAGALAERPDLAVDDYLYRLDDASNRLKLADASLDLSYQLLIAELQKRLRALAVFPDTFDHAAAATVWEIEADAARDALGELLRYSLVEWGEATGRYRLHDLARRLHAEHYRAVLALADDLYLNGGDDVLRGLALFDLERPNVDAGQARAAALAAEDDAAARLCHGYANAGVYVLDLRHHPRRRIEWLEAALGSALRLRDRAAEAGALANLGLVYFELGEPHRAIEYHEQALAIHGEIGDHRSEGTALGNLGIAYDALGEPRRAIEFHEQALAIHRETTDRRGEGNALGNLGIAYAQLGEPIRAIELYNQQLEVVRKIGDRRGEGTALSGLSLAYVNLGEPHRAIEHFERAVVIHRELGDQRGEGNALWNMALALDEVNDRALAVANAQAALEILEQIEDPSAPKVREALARWRGA